MSWLSGETLVKKVRANADIETRDAFYGVYPIDQLPAFIPRRPFLIIINTQTHNLPGEHWKAILIDVDRNGELFDSLALPVSNVLIQWLNRFTIKWKTNKRSFQHVLSATCGAFVLYFILNRLRVKNFDSITAAFTSYPVPNESFVTNFYRSLK